MSSEATRKSTAEYANGQYFDNSPLYRGQNDLVVQLAQLVGRTNGKDPELLSSLKGALLTAKSLYQERGQNFIYYVRGTDTNNTAKFVSGSEGKAKKIVTFPINVLSNDIIRVTIFYYQNPVYPTKVTSIFDYEETASWYMTGSNLVYDVNSTQQNNTQPN